MKARTLTLAAAAILLLAAASAVTLADFGDDDGAGDIQVIRDLPGGSSCVCPQNWDPVVCRAPDGTVQWFSNGCVAGCYGFTSCARIAIAP